MARGRVNTVTTGTVDVIEAVLEGTPMIEEVKAEEVVIDVTASVERKVKVKPKATFKQYIGDSWYYFKAGEVISVAPNVRDVLLRQGALDVLP